MSHLLLPNLQFLHCLPLLQTKYHFLLTQQKDVVSHTSLRLTVPTSPTSHHPQQEHSPPSSPIHASSPLPPSNTHPMQTRAKPRIHEPKVFTASH